MNVNFVGGEDMGFLIIIDILGPLALGYILKQAGIINDKTCDRIILFNVLIMMTVLNIMSFWVLPISGALIVVPLLSVFMCLISCLMASHFFSSIFSDERDKGALVMSAMLANIGTIGGICAYIIYGEEGFAYVQLFAMPQNVLMVACAFPLAQYYYGKYASNAAGMQWSFNFRKMFLTRNQISILGMILGLSFQIFEIERPAVVGWFFHYLVHILAWVSLMPVGCLIDFHGASRYLKKSCVLIPLKFLIVPAIITGIATLYTDDPILLGAILISSATPSAINAVITARLFKLNVNITIAAFLVTTLFFVCILFPAYYFYVG
jgi:predicted permease